jgi:SAM-dependent methyltransferase
VEGFGYSSYGERIAERYDRDLANLGAEDAVAVLGDLAGKGPVLELGIGTGRVALPLAASGLEVHGIDASPAMVAKLRAKPGGGAITISIGNFGPLAVDGAFSLIFVVFNTFFALLSQAEQAECFRRVAEHLHPGGRFVVEAFVPDPTLFERGQRVGVGRITLDQVELVVTRHDRARQTVTSQEIHLSTDRVEFVPVVLRYAYPAELDLMARLAGLSLESRWGGWQRQPFTSESSSHVSVYRLAP